MVLNLNAAELAFVKGMTEKRVKEIDEELNVIGAMRAILGLASSEEEDTLRLLRSVHSNLLRKIDLELDVPFPPVSAWNVQ